VKTILCVSGRGDKEKGKEEKEDVERDVGEEVE
jgi:hypothetical protein